MRTVIYNIGPIRRPITGIGRYALELIKLSAPSEQDIKVFTPYGLVDSSSFSHLADALDEPVKNPTIDWRQYLAALPLSRPIYRRLQHHRFTQALNATLVENPLFHDISYSGYPNVKPDITTVFDLSHVQYPETHPSHRVKFLNWYFSALAADDCVIVTISESVKTELIENYGISSKRIFVTPLAADNSFKPRSGALCETTLKKYGLSYGKFVLGVGTLEPRKNWRNIIAAHKSLPLELQQQYPLVLVGSHGWKNQALYSELNNAHHVRLLNFVPQADLPFLYSGASVFTYASLYEGFGLPLLEAMQSGIPAITSNNGALSELAGTSAMQVDALDLEALTAAMEDLLNDKERRAQLAKQGTIRAKDFSWQKTADLTHQVYEQIS
ncbi:MAG: glycosyltransferase family 1 protein [Pseudomonadota bacterium]